MNNTRLDWLDALKALGAYWVIVGHFSEYAVRFYPFVFQFHIPLFFFAAGLVASRHADISLPAWAARRARSLLVPYVSIGAVSLAVFCVYMDCTLLDVLGLAKQLALGMRDEIRVAQSLWFLPALFLAGLVNRLLSAGPMPRAARLALCAALSLGAKAVFQSPTLLWSADSAVRYLVYYALGDFCMPFLAPLFRHEASRGARLFCTAAAAVCAAWALGLYQSGTIALYQIPLIRDNFLICQAVVFLSAVLCIGAMLALSAGLCRLPFIRALGHASLAVCAGETASRCVLDAAARMFGVTVVYDNPLCVLLYAAVIAAAAYWIFARGLGTVCPAAVGRREKQA